LRRIAATRFGLFILLNQPILPGLISYPGRHTRNRILNPDSALAAMTQRVEKAGIVFAPLHIK